MGARSLGASVRGLGTQSALDSRKACFLGTAILAMMTAKHADSLVEEPEASQQGREYMSEVPIGVGRTDPQTPFIAKFGHSSVAPTRRVCSGGDGT
jgi:hypothetical protein